ncbi:Thioredoxin-like fold,Alkyl hydroperoxide reductase subunit C/ Thiol specific [Cinara cedri]|uniref:thioredoxin-dependent peroxiredoxin n=1 Tax=Cinara cedri TaxID=506608 RepID=A0A5E4MH67_9HEMI|nr:Thioredoxin-like fold,Alkyl hydroperoxide reductase subunit C/ Thiol specific [Cinara cedri]
MSQSRFTFNPPTRSFNTEWLNISDLKYWLSPVDGDKTKAWCNVCSRMFPADLKVLHSHGKTITHITRTLTHTYMIETTIQKFEQQRINEAMLAANLSHQNETNATEKMITSETEIQSQHGDYQNEGPHTSSSNTQYQNANLGSMVTKRKNIDSASFDVDKKYEGVLWVKDIVSRRAPFWKAAAIVHGHVTELNLNDYNGRYLVLFFYPHNPLIMQSEILSLSNRVSEFRALNTEVVAFSADSDHPQQILSEMLQPDGEIIQLKMPLLSDPAHAITKKYGCYLPELGYSLRAHYIIDTRGILRHVTINDMPVCRNISEILRLVKAFQHRDETKRLCLAD